MCLAAECHKSSHCTVLCWAELASKGAQRRRAIDDRMVVENDCSSSYQKIPVVDSRRTFSESLLKFELSTNIEMMSSPAQYMHRQSFDAAQRV